MSEVLSHKNAGSVYLLVSGKKVVVGIQEVTSYAERSQETYISWVMWGWWGSGDHLCCPHQLHLPEHTVHSMSVWEELRDVHLWVSLWMHMCQWAHVCHLQIKIPDSRIQLPGFKGCLHLTSCTPWQMVCHTRPPFFLRMGLMAYVPVSFLGEMPRRCWAQSWASITCSSWGWISS